MTAILEPLGARILVAVRPLPQTTGLIIRVDRQEYARTADVLAIGPDVRDVRKGDAVVVSVLAGQDIGGQLLLPESAVLAHLDES